MGTSFASLLYIVAGIFGWITFSANVSPEEYNAIMDRYLKILDSTRADIPDNLQQYWIDNQSRLVLKGKFLPDTSNLVKYKVEA